MGKKEISVSSIKVGMNRDSHLSQIKPEEYILAKNSNVYNETGNVLSIQPEHSNVLTHKFKNGYKVIGYKNHVNKDRTYYFLTNPETGMSEVGYISTIQDEIEIDGDTPLHAITQTPTHEFTTLIEDNCNGCLNFSIHRPIKSIVIKEEVSGTIIYWTDYYNTQRYLNIDKVDDVYDEGCLKCDKLRIFPLYRPMQLVPEDLQVGGNLRMGSYQFMAAYCNSEGVEMTGYHSITQPIYILDRDNAVMSDTDLSNRTSYAIKLNVNFLDTQFTHYKVVCIMNTDQSTQYYEAAVNSTSNGSVIFTTEQNKKVTGYNSISLETIVNNLTMPTYRKAEILDTSQGILFQANVEQEPEWNLQPVMNFVGSFMKWVTIEASEHLYQNGLLSAKFKGRMRDEVYPKGIRFFTDTGYVTSIFPLISRPPKPEDIVDVSEVGGIQEEIDSVLQNAINCTSTDRNQYWQFYNTATNDGQTDSYEPSGITTDRDIGKYCVTNDVYVSEPNQVLINIDDYEGLAFSNLQNFINDYYEDVMDATCNTQDPYYNEGLCIIKNILMGEYEGCQNPEHLFDKNCSDNNYEAPCCENPYLLPEFTRNLIQDVWIGLNTPIMFSLTSGEKFTGQIKLTFELNPGRGFDEPAEYKTITYTATDPVHLRTAIYEFVDNNKKDMEEYFIFLSANQETLNVRNLNQNAAEPVLQVVSGNIIGTFGTSTKINGGREQYYKRKFPTEYSLNDSPKDCEIYERDDEGKFIEIADVITSNWTVDKLYKRREVFSNTKVQKAEEITYKSNPTITGQSYYNYSIVEGDGTSIELYEDTSKTGFFEVEYEQSIERRIYFRNYINKSALWFKGEVVDGEVIVEITKEIDKRLKKSKIDYKGSYLYRISIWEDKKDVSPVYSVVADLTENNFLWKINNKDQTFKEYDEEGNLISERANEDYNKFKRGFYLTIEAPVIRVVGIDSGYYYLIAPRPGCYHVYTRPVEYNRVKITYDELIIKKQEKFEAKCTLNVPEPDDCDPQVYETGDFAYWESLEVYPDNKELYDSSKLRISKEDIPEEVADKFEEYFVDVVTEDGYKLNSNTDFTNKPIRHFKYPDSKVTEFISSFQTAPFARTNIYPIGCTIDENIINSFLDISVKNKLITREQRNSIVGYELFVGDRTGNKSIQAKGIAYDMYSYNEFEKEVEYSNFPFNDLGINQFFKTDKGAEFRHPNTGEKNNKFALLSPDIYRNTSFMPTEVNIEGYMYGNSKETITEVKDHPKWVILGKDAKTKATLLSTAEAITEGFMLAVESLETYRTAFGMNPSLNIPGIVLYIASRVTMFANLFVKTGQYRLQWLKTFRDLGRPYNFANRITGVGDYSFLEPFDPVEANGNQLRGISAIRKMNMGRHTITDSKGKISYVNNEDREQSLYLSFGGYEAFGGESKFDIEYPTHYKTYDNNTTDPSMSSRFSGGEVGCEVEESVKKIASPYFSLKNYMPAQYGSIGNVVWKSTSYIGNLKNPKIEPRIFGGDIYITRFSEIRKIPFFLTTAMGQSDLTPFDYKRYSNLGANPTYYCNYELPQQEGISIGRAIFPNIDSEYRFDCLTGESGMYIKPPTKFYLYYHGISTYLVESEINGYFRYAKEGIENHFYPQNQDYKRLTEEVERPIRTQNTLYYNDVYSKTVEKAPFRTIPVTYNRELFDKMAKGINNIIYSDPDNDQYNLTDPWRIYRPFNFWQFSPDKGRLKDIKGIESQQILARFENMFGVFNAVDNINRITPQQAIQGSGGIFQNRPLEFSNSELGHAGTQNKEIVSTEFGHFWVDAERGQVIMVSGGGGNKGPNLQEISRVYNGEPTGMRNWFKQHLPFKIKKGGVENPEEVDIDNSYNGIGISMGWDNRYERLFITKKDYKVKKGKKLVYFENEFYNISEDYINSIVSSESRDNWVIQGRENNRLKFMKVELTSSPEEVVKYIDLDKVKLTNKTFFEDVSWTIAFSPIIGKWISYYDFKPNYYVSQKNYFQTGVNDTGSQFGLWSHLLTNKSYQVFYGKPYNFEVEFPIQNKGGKRVLEVVNYSMEAIKYLNEYDYYNNPDLGMDEMVIYNTTNNSGRLLLNTQKSLIQASKFPKTVGETSQQILQTNDEGIWNVNYFFNRVKNDRTQVNMWIQDDNQIDKKLNEQAISFYGKKLTERLRGTEFAVNIKSKDTLHNKILKVFLVKEDISF